MLKHKKDVLPVFQKFVTLIQTQFSMGIVARERRRGDRPPTKNVIWGIYIWSMWGDKEFVVS
jgi:hypothetical protein